MTVATPRMLSSIDLSLALAVRPSVIRKAVGAGVLSPLRVGRVLAFPDDVEAVRTKLTEAGLLGPTSAPAAGR